MHSSQESSLGLHRAPAALAEGLQVLLGDVDGGVLLDGRHAGVAGQPRQVVGPGTRTGTGEWAPRAMGHAARRRPRATHRRGYMRRPAAEGSRVGVL